MAASPVADLAPAAAEASAFSSFKFLPGKPEPLGPSVAVAPGGATGVNFSLFSQHGTKVTLVLYDKEGALLGEVPVQGRTGDIWHVLVQGLPLADVLYGYKVEGPSGWHDGHRFQPEKVFLDPYAPLVKGRQRFAVRDDFEQFKPKEGSVFRGTFDFLDEEYDWGDDYKRPDIHPGKLIIYEMVIRSFTADASSGVGPALEGTFKGLEAKIPFLKELGINAVELLPVFEYDELEFQRTQNPRAHMVNIWGYSHLSFFAPNSRMAADGGGPSAARREFKDLVKAFHKAGIKVILDVVYNHTVEGGDDDPYPLSWRGIDNQVYYMTDTEQYVQLLNYSGCGNTVSGNHPVTKRMIIDSLRQWVEDYHVDGFRFDLASALCRDPKGKPISAPPLIEEIAKDPILSKTVLLAEPWDCGGLYQVGIFPNWDVWGEWNGKYRDDVRRFIRGDPGLKGAFATRVAGSADLYQVNQRKPYHGINFVIAHDGFTLYDLCAYNEKRNHDNGEQNRDGSNDNFGWNCGAEGETGDEGVNRLRKKQMRNLMVALMVSQGTPMVLSGDEYAQTRSGNNNWYGHDNKMTRFDWSALEAQKEDFFRFYSLLIKFRVAHPLLGKDTFLSHGDISWHESDWDNPDSKFLAFSLHDKGEGCGDLYVAFNTHDFVVNAPLPPAGEGKKWARVADTSLPAPRDFSEDPVPKIEGSYAVNAYTSIILTAKAA